MRRTITTATAAILLAGLAACSNTKTGTTTADKPTALGKPATVSKPVNASAAFTKLSATVDSAKLSGTVTADNDPNHLLGRPGQYASKVTFNDTRIKASDVSGTDKGDVDRGGAIEVFATPADATARAKYIQAVTKSMPMLSEYDYVHGTVLVRVSHYLTPDQAAGYKTAANGIG